MSLRALTRIEEKYAPRISQLFGTKAVPVSIGVGQLSGGRAAEASYEQGTVTYDRDFLRSASRAELRGSLVHELTHAYGVGAGESNKRVETLADYARYALNKNEDPDWNPSQSVLNLAERRGDMAGTDGNGPKVGEGGRMRNTFANVLSKNKVDYKNPGGAQALPALDPASTANYYSQLGGLYAGYQNQLVALKQQRVGARADFRAAASQVRSQKIGDLATLENQAIERGISGSSADLQARTAVRGAAEAGIQAAQRAKLEGVAGTRIAGQQAGIDYFMGTQSLEAQKLAQQQTLLASQLERNLIVSGQETQMDALKAMFEAITGQFSNGGGRGRADVAAVPGTIPPKFLDNRMLNLRTRYGLSPGGV